MDDLAKTRDILILNGFTVANGFYYLFITGILSYLPVLIKSLWLLILSFTNAFPEAFLLVIFSGAEGA